MEGGSVPERGGSLPLGGIKNITARVLSSVLSFNQSKAISVAFIIKGIATVHSLAIADACPLRPRINGVWN